MLYLICDLKRPFQIKLFKLLENLNNLQKYESSTGSISNRFNKLPSNLFRIQIYWKNEKSSQILTPLIEKIWPFIPILQFKLCILNWKKINELYLVETDIFSRDTKY